MMDQPPGNGFGVGGRLAPAERELHVVDLLEQFGRAEGLIGAAVRRGGHHRHVVGVGHETAGVVDQHRPEFRIRPQAADDFDGVEVEDEDEERRPNVEPRLDVALVGAADPVHGMIKPRLELFPGVFDGVHIGQEAGQEFLGVWVVGQGGDAGAECIGVHCQTGSRRQLGPCGLGQNVNHGVGEGARGDIIGA